MDRIEKERTFAMLHSVQNAIKKDYYDPEFHGINLDARFAAAEDKLKGTDDLGKALGIIAQAVMDLNDSHTSFYPPFRTIITEYGWRMKMYGDKAFITAVKPDSDADKKGLKVGDEVLKLNGFHPTRSEFWKMIYFYQTLNPQSKLSLEVKSPDGATRQLVMDAHITQLKKKVDLTNTADFNLSINEGEKLRSLDKQHFKDLEDTIIWKVPGFDFEPVEVGGYIGKAHGKKNLIIDLRGNSGGYVVTLEEMVGYFFDHDLKIADLKGRKPMDPQKAKTKGSDVYKGKLIVLIDSNSASASEIFARVMQLEKRATILGDVSAGAVMQSRGVGFDLASSEEKSISYGMNLSRADVIMPDGKSLEHVGVMPDELIVPTGKDLAEGRDPVLARALELSGHSMDSSEAGKIFKPEKFIERTTNVAILWGVF